MMHKRENGDPFSVPVSHPYATHTHSQSVDTPRPGRGIVLTAVSPNNSELLLSSPAPGPRRSSKGRGKYIALGLAAILIVAAAVVLPIYFLVIKKHDNTAAKSANGTSSGLGGTSTGEEVLTGGDGSVIVMENGVIFMYNNSFGGYWLASASNPFLDGAKPNSWTPALNESWTWAGPRVRC
ncbi:hypothetical protein K438DRAFT_1976457 [Mycena galopus ATCC 62051]|nr:hypothetical protein K438DRAFT_1976457 [Mycena galopus ATCC 62051]